jgi:aarF domain-containing kinase
MYTPFTLILPLTKFFFELGIESRLATLTVDKDDIEQVMQQRQNADMPANLTKGDLAQIVAGVPVIFNMLNIRRAIIPAANGHCSARALARYYAALCAAGQIPPPHSSNSKPPLGSHIHIPKVPPITVSKTKKGTKSTTGDPKSNSKGYTLVSNHTMQYDHDDSDDNLQQKVTRIFENQKIHDAIMGVGDYSGLIYPDGKFGLGFRRYKNLDGKLTSFGHSGLGGSTGFCDVENNFAMAVTVNKMSLGGVTRRVIQLVCADLGIPLPDEFSSSGEKGPDMQLTLEPSSMA